MQNYTLEAEEKRQNERGELCLKWGNLPVILTLGKIK